MVPNPLRTEREFTSEPYTTAQAFLHELDLTNARWAHATATHSTWIFRGQADADDLLQPSAWRDDPDFASLVERSKREHPIAPGESTHQECFVHQMRAEEAAIDEFAAVADEVGFRLPSREPGHLQSPLAGLARHHGVPSRLLDFTEEPRIAAFWAAWPATDQRDRLSAELAVWALDTARLPLYIKVIRVTRADNPNLYQQRGLFLNDELANHFREKTGRWPSFDLEHGHEHGALVRLTLPRQQLGDLRRLLGIAGFHMARLCPSLDNVTRTLRQRWRDGQPGY